MFSSAQFGCFLFSIGFVINFYTPKKEREGLLACFHVALERKQSDFDFLDYCVRIGFPFWDIVEHSFARLVFEEELFEMFHGWVFVYPSMNVVVWYASAAQVQELVEVMRKNRWLVLVWVVEGSMLYDSSQIFEYPFLAPDSVVV